MRDVSRQEVERLMAAGAQIVEVLGEEQYEDEHLPGAVNIPLRELNRESASRLRRDQAVVVYCEDAA